MKKWSVRIVVIAVLAGLGFWGWRIMFPSPEQVIRKRLTELARTASFSGKEGALVRLANAQAVTSFCTPDVEITVDIPGFSRHTFEGHDELLQAIAGAMSNGRGFNVEFFDIIVTVAPDQNSATANLTAKGVLSGEKDLYIQELKFCLRKVEGKWLIFRADSAKTLSGNSIERGRA
jgi:ketosteroid isomerase-like protein